MKTREKGYESYGFEQGEEKRVKELCRQSTPLDCQLLLDSAIMSNPDIARDLFYSLVCGLSYDELCKIRDIPISKNDFYAYRRKCMAVFWQKKNKNIKNSVDTSKKM